MLAALLFGHIATFVPCARTHALPPASRSAGSFMRAGEHNEREHMRRQDWLKSATGLHYKEHCGMGEAAMPGSIVECAVNFTLNGELVQQANSVLFSIGGEGEIQPSQRRTIHLGPSGLQITSTGKPSHSIERFMHECVHGMRVGGRRRVVVPPSSSLALFDDDRHVELEVKLVRIRRGLGAADFYVQRAGRWPFVKVATLLMLASLARDLFAFCASTSSLHWHAQISMHAVPVADPDANRWAIDALEQLF